MSGPTRYMVPSFNPRSAHIVGPASGPYVLFADYERDLNAQASRLAMLQATVDAIDALLPGADVEPNLVERVRAIVGQLAGYSSSGVTVWASSKEQINKVSEWHHAHSSIEEWRTIVKRDRASYVEALNKVTAERDAYKHDLQMVNAALDAVGKKA